MEGKKLVQAKIGDSVALGTPEYDVINDAGGLRVTEAAVHSRVFERAEIMKRRAELLIELGHIEKLVEQMDALGVH